MNQDNNNKSESKYSKIFYDWLKFKPKKKQWAWGTIAQVYIVLSVIRILIRLATSLN